MAKSFLCCPYLVYRVHIFLCETISQSFVLQHLGFFLSYTNSPRTPLSPGRNCVKGKGHTARFWYVICTLTALWVTCQLRCKTTSVHLTFVTGFC